jgi:hypothetical protein
MLAPVISCLPALLYSISALRGRSRSCHQLQPRSTSGILNRACLQRTYDVFKKNPSRVTTNKPHRTALTPILSRNEVRPVHQPALTSKTRAIHFETFADLQPFTHRDLYLPMLISSNARCLPARRNSTYSSCAQVCVRLPSNSDHSRMLVL